MNPKIMYLGRLSLRHKHCFISSIDARLCSLILQNPDVTYQALAFKVNISRQHIQSRLSTVYALLRRETNIPVNRANFVAVWDYAYSLDAIDNHTLVGHPLPDTQPSTNQA